MRRYPPCRRFCLLVLNLIALVLGACGPQPLPTLAPSVAPPSTFTPPAPTATFTPAPTPTPEPLELVVCQTEEPASLYLYGDDVTARAGVFAALFDGPIDSVGYAHQPVILTSLPSVETGTAGLIEVVVSPGDKVVDAATGAVVPLAEGVQLRQLDGSVLTYAGTEAARGVQMWAEFTLKPGVRWSDGEPVVAADSVFSYAMAGSPDTPVSKFVVDRTSRYEAVENLRTRWTGLPGWIDSQYYLRFWTPLPRHRYADHAPADLLTLPDSNEFPLGWGAFMLQPGDWVKGSYLTLVPNPHYFRASEGLPLVDRLTFRFGLSPETILAELAAGHCHIGPSSVDFSGQVAALRAAQSAGQAAPQFVPDNVFEHLDFGILPAEDYRRPAGNDLFADARVRQAVAYCLDRQRLIDELFDGLSEVPAAYVPSAHPYFAGEQIARYPFDPARGQALLAEAGWQDADGDGVRENGRLRLAVALATGPAGNPFRETLASFVRDQLLANCGLEAQPALHAPEVLYDHWPTGVLFGRRFDLGAFPWRTGIEPPCELYLTEAIPSDQNPGGANNTGYSSPAFDAACLAAQQALDEATRRAQHQAAQVIFAQDLPSLPLFFRVKIGVAGPRVGGYQLDPTAGSDLWNVEALSLARP